MTRPLVRFQPIPEGDPGALATLTVMRDLVNDATRSPWAVDTARRLVDAAATDDPDDVIARIADRFEQYFRFQYDPAPMDRVSSPVLLLHTSSPSDRGGGTAAHRRTAPSRTADKRRRPRPTRSL